MMKRLQKIISDNDILKLGGADKGYKHERMKYDLSDREKVFYRKWRKENKRIRWLNFGFGVLQDLFAIVDYKKRLYTNGLAGFKVIINRRDRYIVATVMQWLGTNCGWCFLEECLKECGYKIVQTDEGRERYNKEYKKHIEKYSNQQN